MRDVYEKLDGGVTAPAGFRAAGVACGELARVHRGLEEGRGREGDEVDHLRELGHDERADQLGLVVEELRAAVAADVVEHPDLALGVAQQDHRGRGDGRRDVEVGHSPNGGTIAAAGRPDVVRPCVMQPNQGRAR